MRLLTLLMLLAVLVPRANADVPVVPANLPPVHALRTERPIVIDGLLDEEVWKSAQACTNFLQEDPDQGVPPRQRSEVRLAFDDDALYVGARLYDSAPDSVVARLARRDNDAASDAFAILLDPFHDKRTGYYFVVSAAGTLQDGVLLNDGWDDSSWDGVWQGRAHRDAQGWACELRIPFSQLRFTAGSTMVWGVNFKRTIARYSESDAIVYTPRGQSGYVSRFPEMQGLDGLKTGRHVEMTPYATNKSEHLRFDGNDLSRYGSADPFHGDWRAKPAIGGDLRTSLGSKLTLNATVNPDFGQVEIDPAVVNLSDVETYFQEKRPFFVEGSSIFRFGNEGANNYSGFNWPDPTFFYSRRIGRRPQGAVPDADYVGAPIGTSILGAAKLVGKLAPSWNFGAMQAITAKEQATLETGGVRSKAEIEPLTYYGVVRTQKEFKDRRQGLGFMTTVAERSFTSDAMRDQLNRSSLMNGMDGWVFLDEKKVWVISGWSAMSLVSGTKARITALQQNSLHYLQRPDAEAFHLNPNATSLSGWGSRYWLNKQKGNVILNAALGALSPTFDVSDIGFQSRSDLINAHIGGGYKWTETTKTHKYMDVLGSVFASYNFDGDPIWGGLWSAADITFLNNWSLNPRLAYNPQTVNDRRTRGGPVSLNPPGVEIGTYAQTNSKSKFYYYIDTGGYLQQEDQSNWYLTPGVEWKPISNLLVSFGPGYEHNLAQAAYVGADPGANFGRVFAHLDQKTVSANVRVNWSVTPNLSVQTFVQPLISSGDYTDYKALAKARTFDFVPYAYPGNQDFNFKSLRGNAVMRWEYLPGSTLFLVWTQQRSDYENDGTFRFGPSFSRLVDSKADNIFLAKLSYYFSL